MTIPILDWCVWKMGWFTLRFPSLILYFTILASGFLHDRAGVQGCAVVSWVEAKNCFSESESSSRRRRLTVVNVFLFLNENRRWNAVFWRKVPEIIVALNHNWKSEFLNEVHGWCHGWFSENGIVNTKNVLKNPWSWFEYPWTAMYVQPGEHYYRLW